MDASESKQRAETLRTNQARLRKREKDLRSAQGKDDRNFSLEGLRLGSLLSQLQALQAVQGLKELRPKGKRGTGASRFQFSDDPKERATQRQWLMFKADWLDALLEDTLQEIEALEAFERKLQADRQDGA